MVLHEKMAIYMPDLQWYPWNLNLIKNVEDTVVFLCLILIVSPLFLISKKWDFCRETVNENKQFKITKLWISNSYLTRQGFKRWYILHYHFAKRATWNHAYSPFQKERSTKFSDLLFFKSWCDSPCIVYFLCFFAPQ